MTERNLHPHRGDSFPGNPNYEDYYKGLPGAVECRLCGRFRLSLWAHIRGWHGMTKDQYLEQFPGVSIGTTRQGKRREQ